LTGAHTLGVGHCLNIVGRLYNQQHIKDNMDWRYKSSLRLACPTEIPMTNLTFVPNDMTPTLFDNHYYRDIMMGRGLFGIDSYISTDPRTAPVVMRFAVDQNYFFDSFKSAFVKLSSSNVLTNMQGEVRRKCYQRN
jgi:peroxidase